MWKDYLSYRDLQCKKDYLSYSDLQKKKKSQNSQ